MIVKSSWLKFWFFLLILALLLPVSNARAQDPVRVYYAGPSGGVIQAIQLDKADFEIVSDLSQAQVFVLNGIIPDAEKIAGRVRQGAGLVLIFGPELRPEQVDRLLGVPLTFEKRTDALSIIGVDVKTDPV
ncbi:MAG: hypothetical protein ACM3PY_20290, partial [Omnitrophica WOR_2 bacterium]